MTASSTERRYTSVFGIRQQTLARVLALLAVVCMAASAVGYLPQNTHLILPTVLMLLGGASLGGALWLRRDWGIRPLSVGLDAGEQGRVRWLALLAGVLLLALLGLRGAEGLLPLDIYFLTPIYVQVLALIIGIALVIVGAGGCAAMICGAGVLDW